MAESKRGTDAGREDDFAWKEGHGGEQDTDTQILLCEWHFPPLNHHIADFSSQRPQMMWAKLSGPLRERYLDRPGGYTRVLRIEPAKEDQAPSAILELVDGPKDMRFALTAKTIARLDAKGHGINDMTAANVMKVTRFRPNANSELEEMVAKFRQLEADGDHGDEEVKKKRVYPKPERSR
jgi:large subunit ribosomal protein L17